MFLLRFHLEGRWFAIDARRVVEVLPLVELESCPGAPTHVVGLLDYRGSIVPVLDFAQIVFDSPSRERVTTRILLFEGREGRRWGLVTEGLWDAIERPPQEFQEAGPDVRWVRGVASEEGGLLQLVDVEGLAALVQGVEPAASAAP